MTQREVIDQTVREHFEEQWSRGDPWNLGTSVFEQEKYASQLRLIDGRRYGRALEIGCGNGYFSRQVGALADRVVALDIAPSAIDRARAAGDGGGRIDFRVANVMEYDATREGPWDLVVFSETIPFLGWLYPMFDVAWLATRLLQAAAPGGRLLMCNTLGENVGYLLRPWMVHTYRDLFRNVGFELETEETFRAKKDGEEVESLISLFRRPGALTSPASSSA